MAGSKNSLRSGSVRLLGRKLQWTVSRDRPAPKFDPAKFTAPYKIHLGPGRNWKKPDDSWIDVDVNPEWGDLVVDFQRFEGFPLPNDSVACVYGSHVFEHMSIWVTPDVFKECRRVLRPGGVFRLIAPDVERSAKAYAAGNRDFPLFKRRAERAKKAHGLDYTLFDCFREDFLSRSLQQNLLGERALAHQNAWDYETLARDLRDAGFSEVNRSGLRQSPHACFDWEGSFDSEALQEDRSLYVEAIK